MKKIYFKGEKLKDLLDYFKKESYELKYFKNMAVLISYPKSIFVGGNLGGGYLFYRYHIVIKPVNNGFILKLHADLIQPGRGHIWPYYLTKIKNKLENKLYKEIKSILGGDKIERILDSNKSKIPSYQYNIPSRRIS